MKQWNKNVLEDVIENHPIQDIGDKDVVYDMVNYFYTNDEKQIETEFVKNIQEDKRIESQITNTQGNAFFSVEYTYKFLKHLKDRDVGDDKYDQLASVNSVFEDEQYQKDLDKTQQEVHFIQKFHGVGEDNSNPNQIKKEWRNWFFEKFNRDENFRNILKEFGHLLQFTNKIKREEYLPAKNSISGIDFGNDIENIIDEEIIDLLDTDGVIETYFFYKFAQERLTQYQYKDLQNTGQDGKIHLCIDVSGSMRQKIPEKDLSKIDFCIASVLVIIYQLYQQNRDFIIHKFSNSTVQVFDSEQEQGGFTDCFKKLINIKAKGNTYFSEMLEQLYHKQDFDTIIFSDAKFKKNWIIEKKDNRRVSLFLFKDDITKEKMMYYDGWKDDVNEFFDSFYRYKEAGKQGFGNIIRKDVL